MMKCRNALIFCLISAVLITGCGRRGGSDPLESKPIRLGATFPLSGEVASYGTKAKQGIELAVDEKNAAGGVAGRKVAVDFQDDRNDKKDAVSIVTKFATIDKMPVVFGSAGSSCTLAIAPVANRNKIILISPISSSAQLSTEGGPFFFRTVPADDIQAQILARWVYGSGKRRVVVIFTNNSWGKPLSDGFSTVFKALGGQVLVAEGVAESTADFRTLLSKVKALPDADAIVSPTYPKEGGVLVKQAKELGLALPLFGGDNWGSPEFRVIAGDAAEGVSYTSPADSKSPSYAGFTARYRAKYGEDPDVLAAYSYDAATAVFKALEHAGASAAPDALRTALGKVAFTGVSGEVAFKENGDLKSEAYDRKNIRNGKVETVK